MVMMNRHVYMSFHFTEFIIILVSTSESNVHEHEHTHTHIYIYIYHIQSGEDMCVELMFDIHRKLSENCCMRNKSAAVMVREVDLLTLFRLLSGVLI